MKTGQQQRVPATRHGMKQKRHFFGGYNWVNDTFTWTIAETNNSSQTIHFPQHLLVSLFSSGRVVLVMDYAAYHNSTS